MRQRVCDKFIYRRERNDLLMDVSASGCRSLSLQAAATATAIAAAVAAAFCSFVPPRLWSTGRNGRAYGSAQSHPPPRRVLSNIVCVEERERVGEEYADAIATRGNILGETTYGFCTSTHRKYLRPARVDTVQKYVFYRYTLHTTSSASKAGTTKVGVYLTLSARLGRARWQGLYTDMRERCSLLHPEVPGTALIVPAS